MVIPRFSGEHRFLSNFYPAPIEWGGEIWPTAEHLYQALKTTDVQTQERIRRAEKPGMAKRIGQSVLLRGDWEYVKVSIMMRVVYQKFLQNPHLRDLLLATGDAYLEEGNHWRDTFWGVCNDRGDNWLGYILMMVRSTLAEEVGEEQLTHLLG